MSDDGLEQKHGNKLVRKIVVTIALAVLAWFLSAHLPAIKSTPAVVNQAPAAVTSTLVWFVAAAPTGSGDRLFSMRLADGVVEEQARPAGWRAESSSIKKDVQVKRDETSEGVWRMEGGGWEVVLRTSSGKAYQAPALLGFFDATHALITARRDDVTEALTVSRSGSVHELGELPEAFTSFGIQAGAFWLATFQPGEGLESPPLGPSSVLRFSVDNTTSTVVTGERVINSLAVDSADRLAYGFENGYFQLLETSSTWGGQGRPLLWTVDHRLILVRDTDIFLADPATQAVNFLTHLPTLPRAAFLSPPEGDL